MAVVSPIAPPIVTLAATVPGHRPAPVAVYMPTLAMSVPLGVLGPTVHPAPPRPTIPPTPATTTPPIVIMIAP